jgi:predicted RNA polymerase sigma factor
MATGPAAALAIVDGLAAGGALHGTHLLPSVRGELLVRLGRAGEARSEFMTAAGLARNQRTRELLEERAAGIPPAPGT